MQKGGGEEGERKEMVENRKGRERKDVNE